jgi:hypothetical protein
MNNQVAVFSVEESRLGIAKRRAAGTEDPLWAALDRCDGINQEIVAERAL